jgi:hypothetical protein
MKYFTILFIFSVAGPVVSWGQSGSMNSDQSGSSSNKRYELFATLGFQMPLYGKDGKAFTDPLAGYSQEAVLFAPLFSTRITTHWAFDIRLSYMRTSYWQRAMERNLLNNQKDIYVTTNPLGGKKKLSMLSVMAGVSYQAGVGRHHAVFNALIGTGNTANQGIGAEVKQAGTNALTTWKIIKVTPAAGEKDLNKNIFLFSAGAKYVYDIGKEWAVFLSADLISTQRTGQWSVEKTNQVTKEVAEYTVKVDKRGFNFTPGVGLVNRF